MHGLKTSLQKQLLHKRIAHLDIGALLFRAFVELFAGHGCAMDSIAARFRADIEHRIPDASGLAIKNLILAHHAQRERIHQRVAGIAGFEARFSAQVRYAKAIPIPGDAADHALQNLVILIQQGSRRVGFRSPVR